MLTQMCRHLKGNELETVYASSMKSASLFFIKIDEKRIVWNYKNKIHFIIKKIISIYRHKQNITQYAFCLTDL